MDWIDSEMFNSLFIVFPFSFLCSCLTDGIKCGLRIKWEKEKKTGIFLFLSILVNVHALLV